MVIDTDFFFTNQIEAIVTFSQKIILVQFDTVTKLKNFNANIDFRQWLIIFSTWIV